MPSEVTVPSPKKRSIFSVHPSAATSSQNPLKSRRHFVLRVGAFCILEFSFIALTACGIARPIPLPTTSVSPTEAKGALTIVSVIWHGLAVLVAKDIVTYIFSAEWAEQVHRSGKVVPGETDIVSRATSGYMDKFKHFFNPGATSPYRLAHIAALLCLILNAFGPGSITINRHFFPRSTTIKVANLIITGGWASQSPDMPLGMDLARLITRLELLQNETFKVEMNQENLLIPWPSTYLITTNETVQYETDVINYDFNCSWHEAVRTNNTNTYWNASGLPWLLYSGFDYNIFPPANTSLSDPMILPLIEDDGIGQDAKSPLTGFLFVGGNSTLRTGIPLNLDGLPSSLIQDNFGPNSPPNITSLSVTALICDPQLKILPAAATLKNGTLSAVIHSGSPVVHNIPTNAANAIFSQSLVYAASSKEGVLDTSQNVDNVVRRIFLSKSTFDLGENPNGVKPLSIDEVNRNMSTALLSSAKGYLSGYGPQVDNPSRYSPNLIDTHAVMQVDGLALTGSKPFLITVSVVVGGLIILLVAITTATRVDQLRTFDLKNIMKLLQPP